MICFLEINVLSLFKLLAMNDIVKITHPSKELLALIEKARKQKEERMDLICDKYRKLIKG